MIDQELPSIDLSNVTGGNAVDWVVENRNKLLHVAGSSLLGALSGAMVGVIAGPVGVPAGMAVGALVAGGAAAAFDFSSSDMNEF